MLKSISFETAVVLYLAAKPPRMLSVYDSRTYISCFVLLG